MLASHRTPSACCHVYSWSFKEEAPDRRLSFQEQILTLSDAANVVWLEKILFFLLVSKRKLLPSALTAAHGWFRLCLVGWRRWGCFRAAGFSVSSSSTGSHFGVQRAGGRVRTGHQSSSECTMQMQLFSLHWVCWKFFIIRS